MPELIDCYVMAPERSADLAARFLQHFLPQRAASFAPEDPSEALGLPREVRVAQVLEHLQARRAESYSMYFRNLEECDPRHAAVMFNGDGSLFLMLSVDAGGGDAVANRFLLEMKQFASASHAYHGWEEPPVCDAREFRARAAHHSF